MHIECTAQQSHPRERIDVSLSTDKTQRPPFPFFPAVPSARKNIFLPLDSNHTCSPASLPPTPFHSFSLPFEVRARIYIALDGVTDTQPWHAGVCLRGLYALAQGAFLFPYKAVRFPAARPLKKTRERGFGLPHPSTLQPPLPSALQVGRALRFLNIPSLGKIM